jgi:hypothetical protein
VTPVFDARLGATAFRLILGQEVGPDPLREADWGRFLRMAAANGVLLRCAARLKALGCRLPAAAADAFAREGERAERVRQAMAAVAQACHRHHLAFMFPAAGLHYPDAGRDLDLLCSGSRAVVDDCLRRELGAVPLPRGPRALLAGTAGYSLPECPATLDVHWARLGPFGEHRQLQHLLFARQRSVTVGGQLFQVPCKEDHLVLSGIDRIHGRSRVTLSHFAWTSAVVQEPSLRWNLVLGTARELGVLPGLSCLLSYLDQVHATLLGYPPPWPSAARPLVRPDWGRLEWRDDGFHFPVLWTNARLHAGRLVHEVGARRWAGASELGLAPLVVGTSAAMRLGRALWARRLAGRDGRRTGRRPHGERAG